MTQRTRARTVIKCDEHDLEMSHDIMLLTHKCPLCWRYITDEDVAPLSYGPEIVVRVT